MVTESGIGADDAHTMEDGCYGFAMTGPEIALVRGGCFYPFYICIFAESQNQ
jgi:hypothetical protein